MGGTGSGGFRRNAGRKLKEPPGPFHTRLRRILKERGIDDRAFAEIIGKVPSEVSVLKNGRRLPMLPLAYRIARALDLTVEDIWPPDAILEERDDGDE